MPEPRKASLLIIFVTVFIDLLGFGMVLPLLPAYAETFGVDEHGVTIGLLMACFSAMQLFFAPMWGRLSDRVGRRPIIMLGLAATAVCYFLFGIATVRRSLPLLFASRIGAGIAGATISTAQAYIADATTLETRARGMALIGAAFGLGFTFGPLLGAGALLFSETPAEIAASPWPGYFAAILSGLAFLLAALKLPESLRPDSAPAPREFFSMRSLREALQTPSIGAILATSFISLVSFGGFETTASLLLKRETSEGGFGFTFEQVLLSFAFIGLVLTFAQGLLVRRLAKKLPEQTLATAGTLTALVGFIALALATRAHSAPLLALATIVEVTGFSLVSPALNSLISRRSDPQKQGGILGVNQSVAAMARIVGPLVAIPLFFVAPDLPYWSASGLMLVALAMVTVAIRGGRDFAAP